MRLFNHQNHMLLLPMLAVCVLCLPLTAQDKAAASKKEKTATKGKAGSKTALEPVVQAPLSNPPPPLAGIPTNPKDPFAKFWNDAEFLNRFMGSYGFNADTEPKLQNTNEIALFRQLSTLIRESPKEAIAMLTTNVTLDSSAVLDFTLATIHFQEGENEKAAKHYETAIAKFPPFLRAHKNLGFARVKAGQYDEAIAPLTKTIEMGAGDGNVFGLLGYCYLNANRYISAEAAYRNAMLYQPGNNDWKMGIIKCQVAQAKYREAIELIEELLAASPSNDSLWSMQAGVYMQMDQPKRAALNYEVVRKLGKANLQTLMLLGDIYMTMEARDLALEVYLQATEMDGEKNLNRSLRAAEILVSRGAWDEAEALFKKIRTLHQQKLMGEEELKLLKLEAKAAMAAGVGERAIQALEQVTAKNPLDGEAFLLLGDFYARGGEREKAEFRFQLAGKIPGFEADAMVKQAQLAVQQQKYPLAIEFLRKSQKIKPRDNVQRYLEAVERVARGSNG